MQIKTASLLLAAIAVPAVMLCAQSINVGPAINNLYNRVLTLENKTTVGYLADSGFLTNETDRLAFDAIGDVAELDTGETNLVLSVNRINGMASYPVRIHAGPVGTAGTNVYAELDGTDVSVYSNGVHVSTLATTNDLRSLFLSILQGSAMRDVETEFSRMSVFSNKVYSFSSPVAILKPEGAAGKDNRITMHLRYNDSDAVTWFGGITWVYGEPPRFEVPDRTYVFRFESLDGDNWRGYVEHVY